MRSVLITTSVASTNPARGDVYSIQIYVIKFVSDIRLVSDFFPVSSTNKTDRHCITEILLKVVLNAITPELRTEQNKRNVQDGTSNISIKFCSIGYRKEFISQK